MIFTAILFVVGVQSVWSDCAYDKPDHTMCKYGETPACELLGSGVSKEDIEVILDAHNKLRNQVATNTMDAYQQPPAANMKQLDDADHKEVWDDELAVIAQRWANQCQKGHDTERGTKKYSYAGQNYAMKGSSAPISKPDFVGMVKMWFDEVKDMKPEYITSFPTESPPAVIGHYTQVVWAKSEAVGCGLISYKKGKWYKVNLLCNYGPGGNMQTLPVYEIGPGCSKCDNGCSEKYNGLCL